MHICLEVMLTERHFPRYIHIYMSVLLEFKTFLIHQLSRSMPTRPEFVVRGGLPQASTAEHMCSCFSTDFFDIMHIPYHDSCQCKDLHG